MGGKAIYIQFDADGKNKTKQKVNFWFTWGEDKPDRRNIVISLDEIKYKKNYQRELTIPTEELMKELTRTLTREN